MVRNLPRKAGDAGSIPGRGTKIPRSSEKLSQHAATRESVSHNERSCTMQRKSCMLQLRLNTAKLKQTKKRQKHEILTVSLVELLMLQGTENLSQTGSNHLELLQLLQLKRAEIGLIQVMFKECHQGPALSHPYRNHKPQVLTGCHPEEGRSFVH